MGDNTTLTKLEDGKRKRSEDEEDGDASSTTESIDIAEATAQAKVAHDNTPIAKQNTTIDQPLFDTVEKAKLDQSCALPSNFSQEYSPITIKGSQLSDGTLELNVSMPTSDGQKTATASQIEGVMQSLESESQKKKSTFASSENNKTATPPKPKKFKSSMKTPPSNSGATSSEQKACHASRVSFQPQPRVMLLSPSWFLKPADERTLRKCISEGMIEMIEHPDGHDDSMDDLDMNFDFDTAEGRGAFLDVLSHSAARSSFYAISTDKDYAVPGAGIVVPRSFQYYLAVACGMPIVDIEFLATFTKNKRSGIGHQRYPFPSSPGKEADKEKDFCVIGATDHSWNVPQKARAAALERHSSWSKGSGDATPTETLRPGTDLLQGYTVILLGEFDQPNSKRAAAKRKKQQPNAESKNYTRGHVNLLLKLCGAKVYEVDSVTTLKQVKKGLSDEQLAGIGNVVPTGKEGSPILKDAFAENDSKVFVLVNDSVGVKFANEVLNQLGSSISNDKVSETSVVTREWLLDCIGEFEVKTTDHYTSGK